jgi:hypothetical protein
MGIENNMPTAYELGDNEKEKIEKALNMINSAFDRFDEEK